jgi:SAM-dependent methyltransferase
MDIDTTSVWADSMPNAYDRCLGPAVFHPFAVDLARRAARLAPVRVLELAAGSGILTRELIAEISAAAVTATDLNTAMVELGSLRVPQASWQQADAQHLPYASGRFDLVICQFGVMFFPDKRAAFAEMRRVLGPGGHLLFNTWDTIETHGFGRALMAGLERAFPGNPPTFLVRVPHGYTDPRTIEADLTAAGMSPSVIETITLEGRAASAADVATGFCTGTPLRAEIEQRADLGTVTELVAAEMTTRLGSGPVAAPMTAHVVLTAPQPPPHGNTSP